MVKLLGYTCSAIAIAVGLRWIVSRSVEVGIEGRAPVFVVRGSKAVLLGTIAVLIGVYIVWESLD